MTGFKGWSTLRTLIYSNGKKTFRLLTGLERNVFSCKRSFSLIQTNRTTVTPLVDSFMPFFNLESPSSRLARIASPKNRILVLFFLVAAATLLLATSLADLEFHSERLRGTVVFNQDSETPAGSSAP